MPAMFSDVSSGVSMTDEVWREVVCREVGREEEREACAMVAEIASNRSRLQYTLMSKEAASGYRLACYDIARQIRARGEA